MKNKQSGLIPLFIIITVVVIGGGVYYWQKAKTAESVANQIGQNDFQVSRTSENSVTQTPKNEVYNKSPMTREQIEQEKIKENLAANQNKQPVDMESKPCINNIKAEESSSVEYSALISSGWTFKKAIISDFDCDGNRDVIVASYYSDSSQQFFKGNLKFFQKINGSWKLINQNNFSGEPFEIHAGKTAEGGNAVILTFDSFKRTVWIRNGYPTGI